MLLLQIETHIYNVMEQGMALRKHVQLLASQKLLTAYSALFVLYCDMTRGVSVSVHEMHAHILITVHSHYMA